MAQPFSIAPFLRDHGLVGYFHWMIANPNQSNSLAFKNNLSLKIPNWTKRYQQQFASLSHSPELIACWTQIDQQRVGLDIELSHRLDPRLINRIEANPHWQKLPAPAIKLLWSLKEASFKSFRYSKNAPTTISQINILSLQALQPDVWSFEAQFLTQKITGLAGYWHHHTLAICRHK